MVDDLPAHRGSRTGGAPNLHAVEGAATASNKLLTLVVVQIVAVFRDRNLPRELKLFLVPLLFMVPVYSLTILILVGDLTYCIARSQDWHVHYYLVFIGVTLPMTLVILLTYSLLADKYVNTQDLDEQLETVTKKRRSRARDPGTDR
jgi:tellurite resistance protein TehA-like permease